MRISHRLTWMAFPTITSFNDLSVEAVSMRAGTLLFSWRPTLTELGASQLPMSDSA